MGIQYASETDVVAVYRLFYRFLVTLQLNLNIIFFIACSLLDSIQLTTKNLAVEWKPGATYFRDFLILAPDSRIQKCEFVQALHTHFDLHFLVFSPKIRAMRSRKTRETRSSRQSASLAQVVGSINNSILVFVCSGGRPVAAPLAEDLLHGPFPVPARHGFAGWRTAWSSLFLFLILFLKLI